MANEKNDTSDRELVISKMLNAPVQLVWESWTRPEHIAKWWGPDGFTNTIFKMDVRPGGEWDFIMHGPDGTDYKNKSVFREIVLHKKIVYEHISGPKFMATVEFTSMGEKTQIRWQMVFNTVEEFVQTVKTFKADEGLKQNIVKLDAYLAGMKMFMNS
jgi:uncharacterized protein YndB with AHSA1/START domain